MRTFYSPYVLVSKVTPKISPNCLKQGAATNELELTLVEVEAAKVYVFSESG